MTPASGRGARCHSAPAPAAGPAPSRAPQPAAGTCWPSPSAARAPRPPAGQRRPGTEGQRRRVGRRVGAFARACCPRCSLAWSRARGYATAPPASGAGRTPAAAHSCWSAPGPPQQPAAGRRRYQAGTHPMQPQMSRDLARQCRTVSNLPTCCLSCARSWCIAASSASRCASCSCAAYRCCTAPSAEAASAARRSISSRSAVADTSAACSWATSSCTAAGRGA